VQTAQRRVLPYTEIRVPFTVRRREIDDIQRGATDADLDDLRRAARGRGDHGEPRDLPRVARTRASTASSRCPASDGRRSARTARPTRRIVAQAVDRMRGKGIGGPYALAISPSRYTRIVETTEHGGYLLVDHLTGCSAARSSGRRASTARSW
jgi:uncharacterized linocin/CFP29 family protein